MQNIFTKNLSFFVLILTILSTPISFAASKGGGGGPKFSAGAMVLFGQGKMGNGLSTTGNAADRDMLYTPIGLFAGFNLKKFRIGLNYEYMIVGQTTEPATVSNTNISGTGTSPGVRLEYYDGKNSFGLVYRLSDEYKLDKVTFAGSPAPIRPPAVLRYSICDK